MSPSATLHAVAATAVRHRAERDALRQRLTVLEARLARAVDGVISVAEVRQVLALPTQRT